MCLAMGIVIYYTMLTDFIKLNLLPGDGWNGFSTGWLVLMFHTFAPRCEVWLLQLQLQPPQVPQPEFEFQPALVWGLGFEFLSRNNFFYLKFFL